MGPQDKVSENMVYVFPIYPTDRGSSVACPWLIRGLSVAYPRLVCSLSVFTSKYVENNIETVFVASR